jgi:hypothetical protein
MPAYPWLGKSAVDAAVHACAHEALRTVGVPYTDEQIAASPRDVKGKTEMEAVMAYLQGLGRRASNQGDFSHGHQHPARWPLWSVSCFMGIVVWAWSRRNAPDFEEAAKLPFEQD